MFSIIRNDSNDRFILYFRANDNYELVCTAGSEEEIFSKFEKFCRKFPSKQALERYITNYKPYSTTFKTYGQYVNSIWQEKFSLIYSDLIQDILSRVFPSPRQPSNIQARKALSLK